MVEEQEPSGLDALATAAVLGETIAEFGESSSAGATTRHPRHRPGCSCIVCIQPPSGKGKHKPNCFCNVCMTVRRRFKTLMLKKKKRLSDQEAEMAEKAVSTLDNGPTPSEGSEIQILDPNGNGNEMEVGESSSSKAGQQLDLNCDPCKEEETIMVDAKASVIQSQWKSVLAGLVSCSLPKGKSETETHPDHPPVAGQPSPSPPAPPTHPTTYETLMPVDDAVKEETGDKDKGVEDK